MKCPKCGCIEVSKNNFRWTDFNDEGEIVGYSVLQLTLKCKSCGFGGIYPEFSEKSELDKWQ